MMNIQPITPPLRPGQELQCVACGRMGATVADLDGPAFQAYYHPACVPREPLHKLLARRVGERVDRLEHRRAVAAAKAPPVRVYTVELSDEAEGLLRFETRHASDDAAIAWARALRSQLPASLTIHLYPSPSSGLPLFAE